MTRQKTPKPFLLSEHFNSSSIAFQGQHCSYLNKLSLTGFFNSALGFLLTFPGPPQAYRTAGPWLDFQPQALPGSIRGPVVTSRHQISDVLKQSWSNRPDKDNNK